MRLCFLIYFLGHIVLCHSQPAFKIIFKHNREGSPLTSASFYSGLVFNDSMSGYYRLKTPKLDPLKKAKEFGKLIYQHHAAVYNRNANLFYSAIKKNAKSYLIFHVPSVKTWIYTQESKKILGYDCKKAYWVNEYFITRDERKFWFSDSTIVWYADQLKLPFGPLFYTGLPGVVLEVIDQQSPSSDSHLIAVKMEEDAYTISFPKDGIRISLEEFRKMNKHR